MVYSRALFGDTGTPIYGSEDDPNYKKFGYEDLNEENTGYAMEYPEYVRKPNNMFENASVWVYGGEGPKVSMMQPSSGIAWIDASKNRLKIKAALAVLFGLVMFFFGVLAIKIFMKKISAN